MLFPNVIGPAQLELSSRTVLASKKERSFGFFVGYQILSEVTFKGAYAILCLDEQIDLVRGARVFSTLYAPSGYWEIEINRHHRIKTVLRHITDFKRSCTCSLG